MFIQDIFQKIRNNIAFRVLDISILLPLLSIIVLFTPFIQNKFYPAVGLSAGIGGITHYRVR